VGVEDEWWETSYTKDAGGIITVNSDLNEPIHKVHTRALSLWRFLDTKIFSLPKEKQLAKILELKDHIIQRLNDDYQKLYFGRNMANQVVDLPFMTYQDVAYRMLALTCFSSRATSEDETTAATSTTEPVTFRWVHEDHLKRLYEFCVRTESRFARTVELQAQRVSTITGMLLFDVLLQFITFDILVIFG
jgi:enoyl reductase-like protein